MTLTVPMPHTIRVPHGARRPQLVEHDVFNIAHRIKEIDSRLFLMLFEGAKKPWVIYEDTETGPQVVSRYEELTPAILGDLRRMAAIPFMDRFKALSDQIDRENDENEKMDPEKMEKFAWGFRKALLEANMIYAPNHSSVRFLPNRRKQAS